MNDDLSQIFASIAGPPLPKELPLVVSLAVGIYRKHLQYVLDEISSMNPAIISGIHIDMVDALDLNAVAYSNDTYEFVGLNAGLAVLLPIIFNWLLSHPDAFPEVGDPTKETEPSPFDYSMLTMSGKASNLADNAWPWQAASPSDPVRRHFANYASMIAWDFLLMHELGHINRCHLPYLSSKTGSSQPITAWFEFGTQRLTKKELETRCILEVDADGFAGRILSGGPILNGLKKTIFMAFGNIDSGRSSWDWPDVYKTWLRGVGLLFQLMTIIEHNLSVDNTQRIHPHPDIRMQVLVNSIWQRWREVIPDRLYFIELTRQASYEMHEVFRLALLPSPPSRFDDAYSNNFKDKVLDLWGSLQNCTEELNTMTTSRLIAKRKTFEKES